MYYKCIVIDDEQQAVDSLVIYINKIPELSFHSSFTEPLNALNTITKDLDIDFIFLDIEMPDINGIELASSLRDKTKFLIFTTGHSRYALKAFDVYATYFLLKPFPFSRFATILHNIIANDIGRYKSTEIPIEIHGPKFIKGAGKNDFHSIDLNNILYIEASRNYIEIYSFIEKGCRLIRMGINNIEKALGKDSFIRINKSIIISKIYIKKVDANLIYLKNDQKFQLGAVYKPAFLKYMNENTLK